MNKAICAILGFIMIMATPMQSDAGCISVKKAQMILKKLNYFPDGIDGNMGPATRKSIRTFQADYDLKTTGDLDNVTCGALLAEEENIIKAYERKKHEAMIQRVQNRLRQFGYYDGPDSGKKSDIPPEALISFQKEHQIEQTGRLDGQTLNMVFSEEAHEKTDPALTPATVDTKAEPSVFPSSEPAREPARRKTPTVVFSMGSMQYQPKSLYDSTDYEALNETLNPEQAVTYERESFVITRMTLAQGDDRMYLATSRLAGGDNAADFLGLSWCFDLRNRPFVLHLDYASVESDAIYDNRLETIETRGLNGEFLLRAWPGLDWGLSVSHEQYPTLVSCKSKGGALRSIRFDPDFQLSTVNLALRYDSQAAGKTGLFKSQRLVPYLSAGLYGGLAWGRVSSEAIDDLSTDLNHSFSESLYRFNLKVMPEAGIKYRIHRSTYDAELTLGYGLTVQWPVWSLPLISDDDEVEFYRRNLSHGLVLGVYMLF